MARAILHGISVSTGIAIGKCFFVNRAPGDVVHKLVSVSSVEEEAERLKLAAEGVHRDFSDARTFLPEGMKNHAEVLEAHMLICRDPKLIGEAIKRVRDQRMNAEWALEESVAVLSEAFRKLSSPYIRDRIEDIRLVADRILQKLIPGIGPTLASVTGSPSGPTLSGGHAFAATLPQGGEKARAAVEKGILLAYDLTPADVIGFSADRIFSFAIEQGGQTSHTGILARSLRIPAVVGLTGLTKELAGGELIIVDGLRGRVLVSPSDGELAEYIELQGQYSQYEGRIRSRARRPAETEDGHRMTVLANVESAAEGDAVLSSGAEGVGLVRTEFDYITRAALPTEEELYREYLSFASAMAPRKVVFRTLDVGGDKFCISSQDLEEANPALGLRAIRYSLRHQDTFRTQLRAILRASRHGNVAVMFPLISGVSELRVAKSILNEVRQELDADKLPYDPNIAVGIMIEVPSAVLTADVLAREVDFFSIGTNDLIQYSLGIDRGNKHVAHMYQSLHPAIVRAIKQVVDMAHRAGITVSVCGEMAADPYCLPILIGMAVDEISLAPQSIPAIKHFIRHSNLEECRELTSQALFAPTVGQINTLVRQSVYSRFPEDVGFFVSQRHDAD